MQLFVRLNKIQFLHNAFKLQTSTLIFGRCSINVLNNSNNIISPLEEDQGYLNLQKEKGQSKSQVNAMLLKDWCKIVERKKGEEWCIGRGGVRFHRMLYIVAKYTGSKVYAGVFSMQSLSTLHSRPIHWVSPCDEGVFWHCPLLNLPRANLLQNMSEASGLGSSGPSSKKLQSIQWILSTQ